MANDVTPRTIRNSPISAEGLRGVYTALITPMRSGDGLANLIDYEKLYRLIDDQARAGVSGIVVAGTTGQGSTLSLGEHAELVRNSFVYARKKHPNLQFIASTGSNSTREAINLSFEIEEAIGPTTFLHATGYYNNPNQEGIREHFERLATCLSNSNIILYNVPKRTGSNIELETVVELSRVPNIIGIKIANGVESINDANRIVSETDPNKFVVLSGEDKYTVQIIEFGGKGVISATSNFAPLYFTRMTELALTGKTLEARKMQSRIYPFIEHVVFCDINPIPLAHIFDTEVRLPLLKNAYIGGLLDNPYYGFSPEELGIDLKNYREKGKFGVR